MIRPAISLDQFWSKVHRSLFLLIASMKQANGSHQPRHGQMEIDLLEPRTLFSLTVPTTTNLTVTQNSASSQTITFVATVASGNGFGPPSSGLVNFFAGTSTTSFANALINNHGVATYNISALILGIETGTSSVGQYSYTASFGGLSGGSSDPFYLPSNSAPATIQNVSTPPPTSSTHQLFVQQLYVDLFHRNADSDGLASWTSALDHGETYLQVATAMTSSREYDGNVVDAFYVSYLGRHAETLGLNGWVDRMQSGLNAEVIRAGILGSQEYYSRVGDTDTAYVTALYSTFLHRAPEPFGLNGWLAALADPAQRQTVASQISNSDENRTVIVTTYYEFFLHREPDAGGLAVWKNNLANGISQPQIISAFVTSSEYFSYNHLG